MTAHPDHRALPAASYVRGMDGWDVSVPGRVAAWLEANLGLREARILAMGKDNQIYQVLTALHIAADQWRELASTLVDERESMRAEGELSKWMTPQEAADSLGITPDAVRLGMRQGRMPGEKHGSQWRIHRNDFEQWLATR